MPYSNEITETRKAETETQAYKMFTRVAKKVMRLEYGKWVLHPDPSDPIRKVVLSRDIGLATLHLTVHMRDYYHRGVWDDTRWDWKATLAVGGLQQKTRYEDGIIRTGVKLGPRAAKKIIAYVNESVIPHFYKDVEMETARQTEMSATEKKWREDIRKIAGLKAHVDPNSYDKSPVGLLKGCPLTLKLHVNGVRIESQTIPYDEFAVMAKANGWGREQA